MKKFKNAADAYWWVYNHPKMELHGCMHPWIELTPHMVHPITKHIEDNDFKNTELNWWVECGPYVEDEEHGIMSSHDWELDCGGCTAEEAVWKLAQLVYEKYGDHDE